MEDPEISVEEARALVEAHDAKIMEEKARELEELNMPFEEFKKSTELAVVLDKVDELRKSYIGVDENKFTKLNALHQLISRL